MLASTFTTLRDLAFSLPTLILPQNNKDLRQAILQTIVYFDQFDFTLTEWEVYKYLWRKDLNRQFSFLEVREALRFENFELANKQGFYFLPGREVLINIRKARQNIASQKYKKTRWVFNFLSKLPFVELIAICNSLAGENAKEESDIDLFVVVKPGKLWTARFYTLLFLRIFKLRPKKNNKQDKICANFFINRDQLNIQNLIIKDDIYFMYWLRQFTPIYDRDSVFCDLMFQNKWLKDFVNTDYLCALNGRRKIRQNFLSRLLKSSIELINDFNFIEKLTAKIQLKIMPTELKENMNQGIEVVVDDQMLKFHHGHKKEQFRDQWQKNLKRYISC